MYKRSIETRSRNRCCCAKAIRIHILSVWYVALVIQHVKSTPILNCGLSGSPTFFHSLINCTIFGKKNYRV